MLRKTVDAWDRHGPVTLSDVCPTTVPVGSTILAVLHGSARRDGDERTGASAEGQVRLTGRVEVEIPV